MTHVAATYLYRRAIAEAIRAYSARLRTIFAAHGSPIPPSQDCMSAMGNAWATCRVDFFKADQKLEAARERIRATEARRLTETWRAISIPTTDCTTIGA